MILKVNHQLNNKIADDHSPQAKKAATAAAYQEELRRRAKEAAEKREKARTTEGHDSFRWSQDYIYIYMYIYT